MAPLYNDPPEENEEELMKEAISLFQQLFSVVNPPDKIPAFKVTHPKTIACVRAEFIIEPDLPEELRVGLFKTAQTFPAWVRFSQTEAWSDKQRDNRSLAIKVLDVPGEKILKDPALANEQDFLMRSYPVFYSKNLAEFLDLIKHIVENTPNRHFFPSLNPFKWRLKTLYYLQSEKAWVRNLLELKYWGTLPFRFGERAMKFEVHPQKENFWKHHIPKSAHQLHDAAKEFLKDHEAKFDFFIQLQTDPEKMPINNAMVRWKGTLHKVATLRIFAQDIDAVENVEMGEKIVLNPWHSLVEHEPLGALNRARRIVYNEMLRMRTERSDYSLA